MAIKGSHRSKKGRTSSTLVVEACARLVLGESMSSVSSKCGMSNNTVQRFRNALRAFGVELRERSGLPAETRATIQRLIEAGEASNRAIAREVGVSLSVVNGMRAAHLAAVVAAGGSVPMCECGLPANHPRWCEARARPFVGHLNSENWLTDEQRAELKQLLLAGEPRVLVARRFGIEPASVRHYITRMSDEERSERERNYQPGWWRRGTAAARKAKKGAIAYQLDIRDSLYVRIASAIPRTIGRSLRDDVISDLYLAVLEGEVEEEAIEQHAGRFIGRGFGMWANRYGPLSLDTPLADDDGRRWVEMIPDEAPLADEILIDRAA
jgi:transposase-like protein